MSTPVAAAPYDRMTRVVSTVSVLAFVGIFLFIHSVWIGALAVLVPLLSWAFSPRGYEVEGKTLRIRRWVGSVEIQLDGLKEARLAAADDLRGCVRVMGSGGLFGYYGLFRTTRYGSMSWYVTNRQNSVLVNAPTKVVLLSPADVGQFLKLMGQPQGEAGPAPLFDAVVPRSSKVVMSLSAGAGVLSLAIVGLAMTYSPGPTAYTLTPQLLTIQDRFFPAKLSPNDVDLDRARIVDLRQEPGWRPSLRIGGFANSHYRSGRFRASNGATMMFYSAGATQLVLLPARNGALPLLFEVREPEQFLAQLRKMWSAN